MNGFRGFDGKKPNMQPLERRLELKRIGIQPGDVFDESRLKNAEGNIDRDLVAVESYTLSGFLIEQMWDELKQQDGMYSMENTERIAIDENFWKNFADRYIALEEPVKDHLVERCVQLVKNHTQYPPEKWTQDERMIVRWFAINLDNREQIGRPSFIDFISVYTRLMRVAEETFIEQYGRIPLRDEYEHMLNSSSLQDMMQQMMMNSRDAMMTVFAFLENNPSPDTDDTSRKFTTRLFRIADDGSGPVLETKEELMEMIRRKIHATMQMYQSAGKKSPQLLRCPVIYIGVLNEMCDWLRHEYMHHYIDSVYEKK